MGTNALVSCGNLSSCMTFTVMTAFVLANEYLRAQGLPGIADDGGVGNVYKGLTTIADEHINAAAGKLGVDGLADAIAARNGP